MARIRSVKPDYWKSEDIAQLSWDARLVFIALWSYVDDNGVGRDNERLITAELFALEEDPAATIAKVSRILDELSRGLRITRYTHEGKAYLYVNGWEHQRIDRPNKPRYPLPTDDGCTPLTSGNMDSREDAAQPSRKSRDTPSSGAVEQGNRGTGEVPPKAGATSAPHADQPALVPDNAVPARQRSDNVRAQDLAKRYVELVPLSKFPGVLGIARQAIRAGYNDDRIREALERVAKDGRPLTVDVLRVELDGVPPRARAGHQAFRNPDDPEHAYGGQL